MEPPRRPGVWTAASSASGVGWARQLGQALLGPVRPRLLTGALHARLKHVAVSALVYRKHGVRRHHARSAQAVRPARSQRQVSPPGDPYARSRRRAAGRWRVAGARILRVMFRSCETRPSADSAPAIADLRQLHGSLNLAVGHAEEAYGTFNLPQARCPTRAELAGLRGDHHRFPGARSLP